MPTNFEPERLKPKLDIVEKPENRVHLKDSNGLRDPVRHTDKSRSSRYRDIGNLAVAIAISGK